MTIPVLGGAIMMVSLTTAILLVWLGLTVLLNSDRRSWGMWLAGVSLLTGGGFFLLQAAVAGRGPTSVSLAVHLQWPLGWFIGLLLPLAWYTVMLWHAGYWDDPHSSLRRTHRILFPLTIGLGVVVTALAAMVYRYPVAWVDGVPTTPTEPPIGIPTLSVAYPLFILLCIGLSISVLSRPVSSPRLMGEIARRRARPWLLATSIALMLATLALGAVMIGLAGNYADFFRITRKGGLSHGAVWGDLGVSCLILVSVLSLGQAVVAYEIFTGKTLPRHGLRRYWYAAIGIAFIYGAVIGRSLIAGHPTALTLMAATLMIATLYALVSWRAYADRDRYMDNLRPFAAGPRVYEALIQPDAPDVDAQTPFRALCTDVLEAEYAALVMTGPLSALAGAPLVYPDDGPPPGDVSDLAATLDSPDGLFESVAPGRHGPARWVIPLWSERGLIGMLLLGPKVADRLYTHEEFELARAGGERLVDTLACTRMAQRLMRLQRQWLADGRVSGRHARRVLHDDIMPKIHTALVTLSASKDPAVRDAVAQLADAHHGLSDLLRELPVAEATDLAQLGVIKALRTAVEDEHADAFTSVSYAIDAAAEEQAAALSSATAEVVLHAAREAVRNAARHARGGDADRPLRLTISARLHRGLEITVEDDGVGLDSPGELGGVGHGVAIHSTMMAVTGGSWVTESPPGGGTRVVLTMPLSGQTALPPATPPEP